MQDPRQASIDRWISTGTGLASFLIVILRLIELVAPYLS
ncbi:hypothetical protein SAMN06295924_1192 [Rathayibacter rathayi NCPPB 2980 = VKM Ac-1601]|nr:hypothetical protein FB469_0723 [Rathayibacter rathayi]SOE05926.1 hypothetical protein SAMN06295924_1192 [Rathayibacter rathayi NCPPB 2980 = VKM Ac-1601]